MKKQMFGAILLSAALAMGTAMPAFAAEEINVDDLIEDKDNPITMNDDKLGGTGETNVHVQTQITQISVTVPLNITFAAAASGGDLTTPSEGTYGIQSKTGVELYIQEVAITETSPTAWKLVAGTLGKNNAFVADPTAVEGVLPDAGTTYGNLSVAMNGLGADPILIGPGTTTYTLKNSLKDSKNNPTPEGQIEAGSEASPTLYEIDFEGSNSILNTVDADGVAASTAFSIVYTISIQPNRAA